MAVKHADLNKMTTEEIREYVKTLEVVRGGCVQLIAALPACPEHGQCIPHMLEWIKSKREEEENKDAKGGLCRDRYTWISIVPPIPDSLCACGQLRWSDRQEIGNVSMQILETI